MINNNITGSLYEKNGIWQMSISYYVDGKRKQKSRSTKLPVKGNKKKALVMLDEFKNEYKKIYNIAKNDDLYFEDFMLEWLTGMAGKIRPNTLVSYRYQIEKHIIPYFKTKHILLSNLKTKDISEFYDFEFKKGLSPNSIKKYHANIHKALTFAVREDIITTNPADHAELPKMKKYAGNFYDGKEIQELYTAVKNTTIEVPVKLTCFYGFRRSEVLGLKWSAIDFNKKIIHVNHTTILVGSRVQCVDDTKNETSNRDLMMSDEIVEFLKNVKKKQQKDKIFYGNMYYDSDYVCRFENGQPIKPNYLSQKFKSILEKNGLRHIRFHDLRHSSASMLLNMGYQLKDVQSWLGHKDITVTANIYGHIANERKSEMANSMSKHLTNI